MSATWLDDLRMQAAVAELTDLVGRRFPGTDFQTELAEEGDAVFVTAIVDVDDPDEVVDCFIDRAIELQVGEGLPVHLIPVRTMERNARLLAELQADPRFPAAHRTATG